MIAFRASRASEPRKIQIGGLPKIRALFEATYFAGLRNAGVPEQ
jgi:hypothetical protein